MELMRRRGMMAAEQGTPIAWDYEWSYSDGLPENNGMTKTTSGTSTITMTSDGLKVSNATNSWVRYTLPTATMTTGIIECTFVGLFDNVSNGVQNLRLCASNGSNGGQTLVCQNKFRLFDTNLGPYRGTAIADYENNTEYTVRIEKNGSTFDVYINGQAVVLGSQISGIYYATGNFVMVQNTGNAYSATIKAIRAKYS